MSMDEALRSFTTGPAYAAFQENNKGMISAGMWADLTILDRDIVEGSPSELLGAKTLATVVAGEVVFSNLPGMKSSA